MRPCNGCGIRDFDPAPMLRDEVWAKLADARELLCDACMWRRQRERHVSITLNALKPCPVNVARGWFDLFARLANGPPNNIEQWRASARDPWVLCRRGGKLHPWIDPDRTSIEEYERFKKWLDDEWNCDQKIRNTTGGRMKNLAISKGMTSGAR
jgi:hypothetical protein